MMSRMSGATLSFLVIAALSTHADASNAFLKADSHLKEESISEADVQTSLLAEVEGALGQSTASSRVEQLKKDLGPIYAALPKNGQGNLGHTTVRYALHRLFVQRHGWNIKGLNDGHRNSTSSAGLLTEQVPSYIQELFEKRLGGRGFGLHDLSVVAATIEHLIHTEAIKRVGYAFKVYDLLPTASLNQSLGDEVLDTYIRAYILGQDLSTMQLDEVEETKTQMPDIYMAWNETQNFARGVRRDVVRSDASAEQTLSGELDFSLVSRVAERWSEKFGAFQHHECETMKASLVKLEEKEGMGRVRLSDFYKPALNGHWQFQETVPFLRQLGALDESDPDRPRVIIVNYIISPANCIASSNYYAVCCMDECEGLLGQLEQHFAGPEATPDQIAKRVSMLSSSSVDVPRTLSPSLLSRLGEIAAEHSGSVPLHGRLFAQWMHHAFPRECPYPHLSGSTNPQTQWDLEKHGEESQATEEEMLVHVEKAENLKANMTYDEEIPDLPWSLDEELLVVRQPQQQVGGGDTILAHVRNVVLFMAVVSIAYGLVHNSMHPGKSAKDSTFVGREKFLV